MAKLHSTDLKEVLRGARRLFTAIRNGWFISLVYLVLEGAFCILYLAEVEYNISNPCNKINCNTRIFSYEIPQDLVINRSETFYGSLLIWSTIGLALHLFDIILAESSAAVLRTWTSFMEISTTLLLLLAYFLLDGQGRFIYVPYFLRCFLIVPYLKKLLRNRSKWKLLHVDSFYEKLAILVGYMFSNLKANFSVVLFWGLYL